MGRRGNIFAQLTTRQLDSSASKKFTQQDAVPLAAAESLTEAKSDEHSGDTEKAAKVEQAVNAITEELSKSHETSTSAPVTNSEEVIPPTITEGSTTQVEKAAEEKKSENTEDSIDFTPSEDNHVEEPAHQAADTSAVESANHDTAASVATNDQNNNSADSSNSLEL
jgi:hypothetical protein